MLWLWLCIGIGIIALVAVVLVSHFEVKGVHIYEADRQNIHYNIRALFGLVRLKLSVPILNFKGFHEGIVLGTKVDKVNANEETDMKEQITPQRAKDIYDHMKLLLRNVDDFSAWLSSSLARVKCEELRWHTAVGTGDAASTAVVSGLLWGVKSSCIAFLSQRICLVTAPQLNIRPEYNAAGFSTELVLILRIRHVEIVRSAWMLLLRIMRVKGGLKVWRSSLFASKKA